MRSFVNLNSSVATREADQLFEKLAGRSVIDDIFNENSIHGNWDSKMTRFITATASADRLLDPFCCIVTRDTVRGLHCWVTVSVHGIMTEQSVSSS